VAFDVSIIAAVNATVFWDVKPSNLINGFRWACVLHILPQKQRLNIFRNICKYLPQYTASHPKRQYSSDVNKLHIRNLQYCIEILLKPERMWEEKSCQNSVQALLQNQINLLTDLHSFFK
jgi:hypothetical protein